MTPRERDRDVEKTRTLRVDQGEEDSLAGEDQQEAELPIGPMREAIVDLHPRPEEDPTIAADRAAAEKRGETAGEE
jgi:hypothetical protein